MKLGHKHVYDRGHSWEYHLRVGPLEIGHNGYYEGGHRYYLSIGPLLVYLDLQHDDTEAGIKITAADRSTER